MRFTKIKNRKYASVIYQISAAFLDNYTQTVKETKWNYHKWKGLTLMKDPMTLSVYMMIIQERYQQHFHEQ